MLLTNAGLFRNLRIWVEGIQMGFRSAMKGNITSNITALPWRVT